MSVTTGNRNESGINAAAYAGFEREQRIGLALALKGRLAVLLVIALWIGFTRTAPNVFYMEGLILAFALLGVAQLWVVTRFGIGTWPLYVFTAAEISVLVVAIVLYSAPFTRDLPIPLAFRFEG